MNEWVRRVFGRFTPHYGKCGGAKRDCAVRPEELDWMDKAFLQHDTSLHDAQTDEERQAADKALGRSLRAGDPKKLTLWGKTYRQMAMLIFKP